MKKTDKELDAEIRQSLDKYSLLGGEYLDKMDWDLKAGLKKANRLVEQYLDAGIPWSQIRRLIVGRIVEYNLEEDVLPRRSFDMDFENSLKLVNFKQALPDVPQLLRKDSFRDGYYIHRRSFGGVLDTLSQQYVPDLAQTVDLHLTVEQALDRFGSTWFFKEMSDEDVLKVARLRADISHTTDETEKKKKIQELFQFVTTPQRGVDVVSFWCRTPKDRAYYTERGYRWIEGSGDGDYERFIEPEREELKKTYTNVWLNEDNCMAAYKVLERMEQGKKVTQKDLYSIAAKRVMSCENAVISCATYIGQGDFNRAKIHRLLRAIKNAEVRKDRQMRGDPNKLNRIVEYGEWEELPRNTFFKNRERD